MHKTRVTQKTLQCHHRQINEQIKVKAITTLNAEPLTSAEQWLQLNQWFAETPTTLSCDDVKTAIDQKTKPQGSLGQLEIIAAQIALLQNTLTPTVQKSRTIVFGADHGIADEGVSAFPAEVTTQMMANFANGGAAVSVLAEANSVHVEVVDVGVKNDLTHLPSVVHAKVANGTSNFCLMPAMSSAQRDEAIEVGRQSVLRANNEQYSCIGLGEMGIANTSSASAIVALLLDVPALSVTGSGTGVNGDALLHKSKTIQKAIDLHRVQCTDAMSTLAHVGGFEIAAMVGAMLEAGKHQLPILVDGFISSAAALVAVSHDPTVRRCMFFSHLSAESGHTQVLHALQAYPLLQLNMRLGEGSATALALPLLRAACAMLANMSTFAQAGVSDKST